MDQNNQQPNKNKTTSLPKQLILAVAISSIALLAACDSQKAEAPAATQAATESALPAPSDNSSQAAVGEAAMNEADYRRHVETLASDEFGGRGPASPGEQLTVDYITNEFTELGIEPVNGDSYVQNVPLTWVNVTNNPVVTISGGEGDDMSLNYTQEQVIWSRQHVTEIGVEDSDLVFVGYGINAPERNWNDYSGVDVKGKTVVMLVNDPGYATQDSEVFNGNSMTYYGRWDYKYDEAARQGAAAAIIIHDTLPAAYGWATVTNSWTGPQFDMVLADKGAELASVEGWVTKETAAALFQKAGLNLDEMYQRALQPDFEAIPMGLKASTQIVSETENVDSRNVAGMVRGSEAPDEFFIYMAHWDHLGTDPKLEGDQIYNGALDNATGTAALLELARAFATLPTAPRRSVMFLAVAAEEQGLLGSAYYAANPLVPLNRTVGGLNMDGMNNFGPTRDLTVVGLGMSELEDYLAKAVAGQERVIEADREAEKGYFYRSDHFELAKQGVPMLYPGGGYDHREKGVAYGMQKSKEYTSENYHQVSDEYDLSWDVTGAMEDMRLYFETGLSIANSEQWPNWREGTEFKAKRDAQMAGQ
jgi:Zn-dependent M28 family amino/carboxypeptidase